MRRRRSSAILEIYSYRPMFLHTLWSFGIATAFHVWGLYCLTDLTLLFCLDVSGHSQAMSRSRTRSSRPLTQSHLLFAVTLFLLELRVFSLVTVFGVVYLDNFSSVSARNGEYD